MTRDKDHARAIVTAVIKLNQTARNARKMGLEVNFAAIDNAQIITVNVLRSYLKIFGPPKVKGDK